MARVNDRPMIGVRVAASEGVAGARRVAIDARAAARPELGGVERWARELSVRLPALRPERYVVLRPPRALAHRAGHAWEQAVLPLRARHVAAVLCPANLAPVAHPRTVVVLHDAAPLRHPGWYSRAYAAWQRWLLPVLARRALHVIAPSEFSRRELAELLGLVPEGVSVVPGGVDAAFSPATDAARARALLGLRRPYVLCVASLTARKNLAALVPAARALGADGVEVVVAGGHRPQFAAEPGLGALRLVGHVPDALLPGLYAGAEAFALPSLYEGFGLPVLEAMAAGVPVVAANRAALPETCGGAARLVPPDAEAFRDALAGLLGDAAERERLRAAGLERAARFSWKATARGVDAVLARTSGR
jgi:glycosyltransferase involved in cell wall biosynthesis